MSPSKKYYKPKPAAEWLRNCAVCGKTFRGYSHRLYCSQACRQKAYLGRKKDKADT